MAKPKIFVSHSTKDNAFATKLVNDLKGAGADAWMDVNDLGAGSFPQRIGEALADCQWFLLVLTRNTLASEWVKQEVDAAIVLKNQGQIHEIIIVKADSVEPRELPPLWRIYNIFTATAEYSTAFHHVLKVVGIVAHQMPKSDLTMGRSNYFSLLQDVSDKIRTGKFANALAACEEVLREYPFDPMAWQYKAEALRGLGRDSEADAAATFWQR